MDQLISPAINFALLVGLLVYFLRKPVIQFVASRSAQIRTQVEEAAAMKREAEAKLKEFEQKLRDFEKEAKELIENARLEGESLKTRIIENAQKTAERMIKDADATVQANVNEFKDQIRRETIEKAIQLAESTIRERLSDEDQRRFINDYVQKVQ